MKEIKFEEIRKGDLIKVEWNKKDTECTRKGVAHTATGTSWYSAEDEFLVSVMGKSATIYLLDRPKPPLPTTPGTIFRATAIRGEVCDVTVFVRSSIPFGRVYVSDDYVRKAWEHNAVQITAWEPIEGVTV